MNGGNMARDIEMMVLLLYMQVDTSDGICTTNAYHLTDG
jgi:hypothetical protein